ncbi:MAG: hypothetical protein ACI85H_001703 [Paracoccaceae bacterium]|jgi:hypothetical protein
MMLTARPMEELIDVSDEVMAYDENRKTWLQIALEFTRALPQKEKELKNVFKKFR